MGTNLVVALDGLAYGMLLVLVASGLTLTLGIAHVLNLTHGTLYLIGAYIGWTLIGATWAGMVAALGAAAVLGTIAGTGIAGLRALVPDQLQQALATIGIALIAGYLLTEVFGAEPRSVDPPRPLAGSVTIAGQPYPTYRLALIAAAAVVTAGLWLTVARTRAGARLRAAAENPARLATLGVEPRRVHALALAAGGVLATLAGVLGAPVLGPAPGVDYTVLVLSLIIVVAGGPGSIGGALLAGLAVGQLQTTAVTAWPTAAPYLIYGLLAVVLALRAVLHRRAGVT